MWSPIALFYFACLLFGFLFALIGAIFGELGSHLHIGVGDHDVGMGHDVDMGHDIAHDVGHGGDAGGAHGPGASVLNSLTVTTFIGSLGIAGLTSVWYFKLGPLESLVFSVPVAVVLAACEFLLYVKVFINAQASSEATLSEVLGCEAEVLASIPGDRVGQIGYVVKGSRYTAPAASADHEDIPRGTRVRVVNIRGTTFVVRPMG